MMPPRPTTVQYNDWRQAAVESLDTFAPTMPVSVIIPSYQTPAETLARTLASLEGQTYPRELFEVIIVDDGSEPPLSALPSTPLDVRVARQERRGFGAPRARNNGARAAAHDILLFLDADMLVEAGWMADHARWHHVVSDALSLGARSHVSMDGIDAEAIRRRPGTLEELFSDRSATPSWTESYMNRTNYLTSRADDLFSIMIAGDFGIGRDFFWTVGGFDESFTGWGAEDKEFCYRAYTYGGLLAPVRDACAWHQGSWEEGRETRRRISRTIRGQAANLIAHVSFRQNRPGRIFTVPQFVATIDAGHCSAYRIIDAAANILADSARDLVVRIEMRESDDDDERLAWLQNEFGSDPRVRIATGGGGDALDEFPASPFHITLPAGVFAKNLVHRLRVKLGDAVSATATLPDGGAVTITRTWALHRSRRTGKAAADFGESRKIAVKYLKLESAGRRDDGDPVVAAATPGPGYPSKWDRLLDRMRAIRNPAHAWAFLKWLADALIRRANKRLRRKGYP